MTGFTKLWHIKKGLPPPDDDEAVVVEPTYMQRFLRVFKNMCYGLAMMPLRLFRVCCPPKSEDHRPVQGFFSQFVRCCAEINRCDSSLFMWPFWLCRAVRNRHRHAIEQASRRWRTRRKILISTQVLCFRRACHQNYSNFTSFFLGVIL